MPDSSILDASLDGDGQAADASPDRDAELVTGPFVFTSSSVLSGDSIPRAEQTCQQLADMAGLEGRFVPWISTVEEDAIDRLQGDGPWNRTDGALAFADRSAISSGPEVALDLDESGTVLDDVQVYTGTDANGRWSQVDCRRWRSYYPEDDGTVGSTKSTDGGWTASEVTNCGRPRRVYCFQQAD